MAQRPYRKPSRTREQSALEELQEARQTFLPYIDAKESLDLERTLRWKLRSSARAETLAKLEASSKHS